jgi:hypothetical protein
MGWWSATKKAATATGRAVKRRAGQIARTSAVAAAGVGGSLIPGCGPICGVAAATLTNELLGGAIERGTRRAIDRTGAAADDFVDYLQGGGKPAPRPPGMATTVSGTSVVSTVAGSADEEPDYSLPLAIAAATITTAIVAVYTLKRTGRI